MFVAVTVIKVSPTLPNDENVKTPSLVIDTPACPLPSTVNSDTLRLLLHVYLSDINEDAVILVNPQFILVGLSQTTN